MAAGVTSTSLIPVFSPGIVLEWRRESIYGAMAVTLSRRRPSTQAAGPIWVPGHRPDEIALAPFPRWLIAPIHGARIGRSVSDWRQLVREGVAEGQRNSTIASLTGHLLWHNVDPCVALELMLAWNRMRCRPPLDDAEVADVVASITKLHDAEAAFE